MSDRNRYMLSEDRVWIALDGHLGLIVRASKEDRLPSRAAPISDSGSRVRAKALAEYTSAQPRAAMSIPLDELRDWAAKGAGDDFDRQYVLGGIYDRTEIARALESLGHLGNTHTIRLSAAQSAYHGQGLHVLLMTCDDWTAFLMCCAEDTETGNDPFPIGGPQ